MPDTEEQETPEAPAPTPTDDSDTLGDAGKRALDKERQARRDAEAKLKEAQARLTAAADAEKSELEKLNDNLSDARTKAEASSAKLLQLEVALEAAPEGMSIAQVRKLAKRLNGATRDELLADAEELFGDFGGGRPPKGGPTPTPKGGSDPTGDDEDFDPDAIAKQIIASPW